MWSPLYWDIVRFYILNGRDLLWCALYIQNIKKIIIIVTVATNTEVRHCVSYSAQKPVILTEILHGFPQSLEENAFINKIHNIGS
jgi:hypothetical protein